MTTDGDKLVLITGGSSFIGLHALHQAVQQGYRVRTTVRSESKRATVESALKDWDSALDYSQIEYVQADLLKDEGWHEAVRGCDMILHIASPFPASQPKDEMELIRPAREGTLRVLRAAAAANQHGEGDPVRVVIVSSVAAVAYGGTKPSQGEAYTEADWTNVEAPNVAAYVKSKTLAERAAWDFVKDCDAAIQLSTVNPVGVFGPPIRPQDGSTTCDIIKQMMDGSIPLAPRVGFAVVDVRDVVSLLFLAATKPEANGQRYLATGSPEALYLVDVAATLRKALGPAKTAKTPTRTLPDWLVKVAAPFSSQMQAVASNLGKPAPVSNAKARLLGWQPISSHEAVVATAQRFLDKGYFR